MRRTAALFVILCALSAAIAAGRVPPVKADDEVFPLYAEQDRRDRLVGSWYGETPPTSGGRVQWIIERARDGTFKVRFRIFSPGGSFRDHVETGIWGVSGPIYFSATQGWLQGSDMIATDTDKARFYDAYEILTLEPKLFEYRHFVTGTRYRVRKVSRNFQFP